MYVPQLHHIPVQINQGVFDSAVNSLRVKNRIERGGEGDIENGVVKFPTVHR